MYQRYGGVSMYYTQQGTEKISALLERDGITGQYDDTLYAYAKAGELNGYCSKPTQSDLVYITGKKAVLYRRAMNTKRLMVLIPSHNRAKNAAELAPLLDEASVTYSFAWIWTTHEQRNMPS